MTHPYSGRGDHSFWKRAVAGVSRSDLDPIIGAPPFSIGREDPIATAGSCFAQHISRRLERSGYHYLVTEDGAGIENCRVFPARYGNIYTVRQLVQLFDRAYGLFRPQDEVWRRPDGVCVDPFRPQIQRAGFASAETLAEDRKRHLTSVRTMFEQCSVFVFTLGLTEGWISREDGAVFPLAPGVAGGEMNERYAFRNFSVTECVADLKSFLNKLRLVNSAVRVILTVSPVPLVATYEDRHVLLSNAYSKAVLRVAAEEVSASEATVCYFPSYEIITGAHAGTRYFAPDLRSVTEEGVDHVMRIFSAHFLGEARAIFEPRQVRRDLSAEDEARLSALADVVCEEEALGQ